MTNANELYDEKLSDFIEEVASFDISSEEATIAMKNLKTFSDCRPPITALEPDPEPVPTTTLGKVKAVVAKVWDNETTRVCIKAGGTLAGVVVVTYATIHKDHVIERQAIAQANQRN